MKKIIIALSLILVFLTACSLNSGQEPSGTVINGRDQLGNIQFKESDVLQKINELNNGVNQAGNDASVSNGRPEAVEIENLAAKYDQALVRTNFGDIKFQFYAQESPLTVNNFMNLAKDGFYNGTKFHRVINDFMIQGGDPLSKDGDWSDDGRGGPGYNFKDEINAHKLVRGSLAMANAGPNTNGSQFFIVTAQSTPHLDGKHTNFGEVIEGMSVVDKIEAAKTDENDHPLADIVIEGIDLLNSADTYELSAEEQSQVEATNPTSSLEEENTADEESEK